MPCDYLDGETWRARRRGGEESANRRRARSEPPVFGSRQNNTWQKLRHAQRRVNSHSLTPSPGPDPTGPASCRPHYSTAARLIDLPVDQNRISPHRMTSFAPLELKTPSRSRFGIARHLRRPTTSCSLNITTEPYSHTSPLQHDRQLEPTAFLLRQRALTTGRSSALIATDRRFRLALPTLAVYARLFESPRATWSLVCLT